MAPAMESLAALSLGLPLRLPASQETNQSVLFKELAIFPPVFQLFKEKQWGISPHCSALHHISQRGFKACRGHPVDSCSRPHALPGVTSPTVLCGLGPMEMTLLFIALLEALRPARTSRHRPDSGYRALL